MNIGIIGTGQIAWILGAAWGVNGHSVCFGADEKQSALAAAQRIPRATAGTYADAAGFGEAVLLALSWRAALDVVPPLAKQLARKTIIDATTPVDAAGELESTGDRSIAEQLASRLAETAVVKALNGVTPETLRYVLSKGRPYINGQPVTVFYCGDDPQAKLIAEGLIGELNLELIDIGELRMARVLEPVGVLAERLRKSGKFGDLVAISAVHELRDHSVIDRFM
jgi:8-hydroxy-5-deazaflavin:NADPH oxidoreductase